MSFFGAKYRFLWTVPLTSPVSREEVSYIKKELIDARSRKAAAEDDLNTVKGTVETLNNSVNSLSIEGKHSTALSVGWGRESSGDPQQQRKLPLQGG
jgi:hypothetical protein